MTRLVHLLATGCGAGYVPGIPGTAGSLLGLLLAVVLAPLAPLHYALFTATFALLAVWIADRALCGFQHKDPKQIVIDEVAGYLIVIGGHPWSWRLAIVAFCLFRVFDMVKPPPCRALERLPGGWGIVADDCMAAVYANLCLWGIRQWVVL